MKNTALIVVLIIGLVVGGLAFWTIGPCGASTSKDAGFQIGRILTDWHIVDKMWDIRPTGDQLSTVADLHDIQQRAVQMLYPVCMQGDAGRLIEGMEVVMQAYRDRPFLDVETGNDRHWQGVTAIYQATQNLERFANCAPICIGP